MSDKIEVPTITAKNTQEVWDQINMTAFMFVIDETMDEVVIHVDTPQEYNDGIDWLSQVDAWPNGTPPAKIQL